jgi:hypothetical protein
MRAQRLTRLLALAGGGAGVGFGVGWGWGIVRTPWPLSFCALRAASP